MKSRPVGYNRWKTLTESSSPDEPGESIVIVNREHKDKFGNYKLKI